MSHAEHRAQSPSSVRCFVLTVSDTRTEATDTAGRAIDQLLQAAGHRVVGRAIVRDEVDEIRNALKRQLANPDVDAIITTGGTGVSPRDGTYEVVSAILQKRLDGFGELFRMLSFEQIGAAAMLSRACGGVAAGRVVFALPGSEAAVRLAVERLIAPELGHVVREIKRKGTT
jgi:molybdenum cofactor biosynthesis protein B